MFFLRNDSKEKNSDEQDPFFFLGGGWGDIFFLHPKFRKQKILKTINDLPTFFLKEPSLF